MTVDTGSCFFVFVFSIIIDMCFSFQSHLNFFVVKVHGSCNYSVSSATVLFEVASSTLCSTLVTREPNMIPPLIFWNVLRVQASETNNWLDKQLILVFMCKPLNGSHSAIINSTASLLTEGPGRLLSDFLGFSCHNYIQIYINLPQQQCPHTAPLFYNHAAE